MVRFCQKQYHLDFQKGEATQGREAFEGFIQEKKAEFLGLYPELDPQAILQSHFVREEWGKVFFLENPFERPYPIDEAASLQAWQLKKSQSEQLTGSKVLGHYAGLTLKAEAWKSPDGMSVIFRNCLADGKMLKVYAPKVDYLELSLYEMLPLYIASILEVLQSRKIANTALSLIDISFDLVGTTTYHVRRVAERCLEDLIAFVP